MERRVREEKEREVQKLRDLQEKAADRQADIDALRAKRAFEKHERDFRDKEKLKHQKQVPTMKNGGEELDQKTRASTRQNQQMVE